MRPFEADVPPPFGALARALSCKLPERSGNPPGDALPGPSTSMAGRRHNALEAIDFGPKSGFGARSANMAATPSGPPIGTQIPAGPQSRRMRVRAGGGSAGGTSRSGARPGTDGLDASGGHRATGGPRPSSRLASHQAALAPNAGRARDGAAPTCDRRHRRNPDDPQGSPECSS